MLFSRPALRWPLTHSKDSLDPFAQLWSCWPNSQCTFLSSYFCLLSKNMIPDTQNLFRNITGKLRMLDLAYILKKKFW